MISNKEKEDGKPCPKTMRKGLWSPDEDQRLYGHITNYGVGTWSSVAELAGLKRSGKSCRLRWMNYLQPDLRREPISRQEEDRIVSLQKLLGNRWSAIAARMPGRTDNEIKNYWNSRIKKKLQRMGTGHYQSKSTEMRQIIQNNGGDSNTDGNLDLYRRQTTAEGQVNHSNPTLHNNYSDQPSTLPTVFTSQLVHQQPIVAIEHGEQRTQSFIHEPFSKSYQINFVEEYVDLIMSLQDDLPDI
ncbi:hypothetical protein HU200_030521 [Digitaria exilis]|uniref:Uncharacterized protein n=1 Tax=Digitaria exilis TaxID=1010633 RepID=A0A835EQR6_9POAL|nr:hypothetical protein HU200_030521 [Digitaria exilis]